MIDPRNLDTLLHPQFDAKALKAAKPMGRGLGASPGAACGQVVFSAEDAEAWKAAGKKVVLVRLETSPEDITGMKAAQGILTVRGGMQDLTLQTRLTPPLSLTPLTSTLFSIRHGPTMRRMR